MGLELGRALLLADAVTPDALANALLASVRDRVSLVRALLSTEAIGISRLEEELALTAPEAPLQRHPVPVLELLARLPPELCESLLAVPVRSDPRTGTVDVALADAADEHAAEEIAFHLGAPVRVVRSPLGAIESALDQARQARRAGLGRAGEDAGSSSAPPSSGGGGPISVPPPSPVRPMAHTPPWGSQVLAMPLNDGNGAGARDDLTSERPIPLVARGDAEHEGPEVAIPLSRPLSRRMTPGAGLVALARAAQELDDEDDPVVELRRPKSSKPPEIVTVRVPPAEDRTSLLPSTPLNQLLREMTRVTARDPLMELVLLALRPHAPKTALFAVKKDAYVGWMCTPDFGERDHLAEIRIDLEKPSLLATTAVAGTYVGPMLRSEAHGPLTRFIKSQQPEVVGAAIRAAGRPVVLIIAHEVREPLRVMSVFAEVARAAGESLERILRAKR